jgi:sortase, SrtB family
VTATPTPQQIFEDDDVPPDDPEESEELGAPIYVQNYAPDIWPEVDFEGLSEINPDIAGWIIGVGTHINYPVVKSSDNAEYLNTSFDGKRNRHGAIFINAYNSRNFNDRNTIIYGHNTKNHSMFWTLMQYKKSSYYDDHPNMRLIRPEGRYELQIFAGTVADEMESEIWQRRFVDDAAFLEWVQMLRDRSTFTSEVTVGADDRVVSLSTCSYEYGSRSRYVLYAKLVPLDGQGLPKASYTSGSAVSSETPEEAVENDENAEEQSTGDEAVDIVDENVFGAAGEPRADIADESAEADAAETVDVANGDVADNTFEDGGSSDAEQNEG